MVYALLHSALTTSIPSTTAPDKGLILFPVLGSLAFGANSADKAWSSQLLLLLQRTSAVPLSQPEQQQNLQQEGSAEEGEVWYDELCLLQQARRLARVLWGQQGCCPVGGPAACKGARVGMDACLMEARMWCGPDKPWGIVKE
eukprot:scaffold278415_cov18-Tisochrysis_lutea.AAC.1